MNATILAVLLTLAPGDNPAPEAYGQVAAVQATTQAAFVFGDTLVVGGAADGDSVKVILK